MALQSPADQGTASIDDIKRYEVIGGVRVEREPMGAFETVLASWLCHLLNSFAGDKKLAVAVSQVLFVLTAPQDLKRRPNVAFVSYGRWSSTVVARAPAWNVVPDLAVEIVRPTNLAEEIDNNITDYCQSGVRLVWVFYPDSGRGHLYRSPTQVSILERTDTLDGGAVLPGFRLPIAPLYEDRCSEIRWIKVCAISLNMKPEGDTGGQPGLGIMLRCVLRRMG
jgi:Uma2 family endonuclease